MSSISPSETPRNFQISSEIFDQPNLDIYTQMVCFVLQYYASEPTLPTLHKISQQGRMSPKQAVRALQSLVDMKIMSHKMFRQIVGEFRDDRLSWAAKGLYTYCKENPSLQFNELLEMCVQSGDGEQSVRKALKELNRLGYLDDFPDLKKMSS